ncbi:MAG: flagellin [Spirochaetes bacterium RBG_16_49_21]|nr:MAG: flagellin [Spirochaetes bacterium RBG_16_49_21]
MRINHNMSAVFASRQLSEVGSRMDKSLERLASGEQIVRAGDDASGLAVSEKMRTQIGGLIQAEKNAQNGLSFIQVAEGSYQQLSGILQRVRVLAVQSANGIYSAGDRVQIQAEISQLVDEVDRIGNSAEFNRMKMLRGNFARKSKTGSMFFHVGANQNERIQVYIATVSSKAFNLVNEANRRRTISSVAGANAMIGYVDSGLDRLNRQRAELGAYYNRMENTIRSITQTYENLMAADSRIRDADMAVEIVEFTKDQILFQTSAAMLAQANTKPKHLLRLFE